MLNAIIVDESSIGAEMLRVICEARKRIKPKIFLSPAKALAYAKKSPVQLAFIDSGMRECEGGVLGIKLKKINPAMFIVFVCREPSQRADCLDCADGFISKPYIYHEIDRMIEYAVRLYRPPKREAVSVRMFGTFGISCSGMQVRFGNAKAEEMLALCIHAEGKIVGMEECMEALWPGREQTPALKCLYRKAVYSLKNTLKEHGAEHIFRSVHGGCFVDTQYFICDYYDYLSGSGNPEGIYLRGYPWAEEKAGELMFEMAGISETGEMSEISEMSEMSEIFGQTEKMPDEWSEDFECTYQL